MCSHCASLSLSLSVCVCVYAYVLHGSPFTVYVVTVRKGNAQWRVFRRFKEWEDLRDRLRGWCGNSPPMPGKVLFGRMRPEVSTRGFGRRAMPLELHTLSQLSVTTTT